MDQRRQSSGDQGGGGRDDGGVKRIVQAPSEVNPHKPEMKRCKRDVAVSTRPVAAPGGA